MLLLLFTLEVGNNKHTNSLCTYPYSILTVVDYAVDGNTDGRFLNSSTTHTQYEQGAWWQVGNSWRSRDGPSFCIQG
jgi:hypothetical protein